MTVLNHSITTRNAKALIQSLVASSALGLLAGCVLPTGAQVGSSNVQINTPSNNTADSTNQSGPAICDPFGNTQNASNDQGLLASLYYMGDTCTTANAAQCEHYTNVAEYFANGIKLDANLIFNQLNVPTRLYNDGIQAQDETIITTPEGNTLYEWFALHFTSQIKLGTNDTAGKYQFAVLSDDGSIFSLDQGSGLKQLINNDGTHPSTLVCAKSTVKMGANTVMPMQMDYFQGPRYQIALVLLWRQIPDNVDEVANPSALNDPACNLQGNGTFFDYNQNPSAPTGTWIGLLSRGWKVLGPSNYILPSSVFTNPCPNHDGSCFTDTFNQPKWTTFELTESGIDPTTIKVTADGVPAAFTYDATLNVVYVTGVTSPNQVQIGYCQSTSTTMPAPSPTPTSTSAAPSGGSGTTPPPAS